MKYKLSVLLLLLFNIVWLSSCKDDEVNNYGIPVDNTPLELVSVNPAEGSSCQPGTQLVTFDFAQEVWLLDKAKITVNGTTTNAVAAVDKQVRLNINTTEGTSYEVKLAAGAIRSLGGYVSTDDYVVHFTCSTSETPTPSTELSPEATKLLNFLKENNGKYILSGTMANVALNTNEAYWVYTKTGKWPAINCIDYIHLYASAPDSWIDYSQTQILEDWWANNGIVAAMWHWNMPTNDGTSYTCTPGSEPGQTSFDIKKINDPESEEYARMMTDIDKVADYLLLLKEKNIPVIWRPLHEAGGKWFWWGMDAESCKTLWRIMYDRFKQKGLNNLIWVWTEAVAWNEDDEIEGPKWYPGDEYVDVVGIDVYNATEASACYDWYEMMSRLWPNKIVTMSECGNDAPIGEQWDAGAHWSWFITWYDYDRTNDISSPAFTSDDHTSANAAWWRAAFENEHVLSRDELPSLK